MKTRRRMCIRPKAKRRTMALSPVHLNAMRGTVAATAARFGTRLAPECVDDVMQETFLNLWRSRSERMLDCLPYLRRAAANTAIDLLRRQGTKKRSRHLAQTFDLVRAIWQPPRTPEETLIEREEAHQLLAESPVLRKRVERLMRQYARAAEMTASPQQERR
jgi:DNA-directed RNA polymerase specialized sigma24 family protein